MPRAERALTALDAVVAGTDYAAYHRATTVTATGEPYRLRNLVVLGRFSIRSHRQVMHDLARPPM